MKTSLISAFALTTLIVAACSSSKKSTSTASANSNSNNEPMVMAPVADPAPAPGNEELKAIQLKFADVTQDKLEQGHFLYTKGACVNCHGAKNIYKRPESEWKGIIDDMAEKARITDAQKDAVYKYVLAIKATQPKKDK